MRGLARAGVAIFWFLFTPALASEADWDDCKAENPDRSIAGCTRIITGASDPPNVLAIAYNNRGIAYKYKQEMLQAFADYTEALRLNPNYARAFYNRGLAYLDRGELARALDDFDSALQIEPNYTKALLSRALLLAEHDATDDALADFEKAFTLDTKLSLPPNVERAKKIITAKLGIHEVSKADRQIIGLSVAIELKPQESELYHSRAIAQFDKGALGEALADLNEAVKLAPANALYLADRCRTYLESGNLQQAAKDCEEAIRIDPRNGFAYSARGMLNLRRSKLSDAEQDLSRAIRLLPKPPSASYVVRGEIYEKLGDRNKAIADYKIATAIAPSSGAIRDVKAKDTAVSALKRLGVSIGTDTEQLIEKRDPDAKEAELSRHQEEEKKTVDASQTVQPQPNERQKPVREVAPPRPLDATTRFNAGNTFRDCADCPDMIVLPAGEFMMGSPQNEVGRDDAEGPQHKVTFARVFAVGQFEVTLDQFEAFIKATAYDFGNECVIWDGHQWKKAPGSFRAVGFQQTGRHPVTCVSWNDAQAYVAWLSRATGKAYRLPTEAEWEYAARAGTTTRYHFGNDPDALCGFANGADRAAKVKYPTWKTVANCNDGYVNTAPVGSFRPNAFGLYDMHGNVSEWVEDCFQNSYQGAPADGSALPSANCQLRVMRGGSWIGHPGVLRSASRLRRSPGDRYSNIGFRVARTLVDGQFEGSPVAGHPAH